MPRKAVDATAPSTVRADREQGLRRIGLEGQAPGEIVGGETAVPPSTPPDEPAAMSEQVLDAWSLIELAGASGLGRLLSAVQRTPG